MSKIAKQKALEAYPIIEENSIDWGQYEDLNEDTREAYIEGYNQAFQDFLEKACNYLAPINYTHPHLIDLDDFKNYIENESEE